MAELIPKNYILKSVRLGEWDKNTDPDCQTEYEVELCAHRSYDMAIAKVIPHENYNPRSTERQNDIAMLKLEKNIKFSDFVRPVCIHDTFEGNLGTATVIGFGRTETGRGSDRLLKTELNFMSHQECADRYAKHKKSITELQICAGRLGADSW